MIDRSAEQGTPVLARKRILLVEDVPFLAMMTADTIVAAGGRVVSQVATVTDAVCLLKDAMTGGGFLKAQVCAGNHHCTVIVAPQQKYCVAGQVVHTGGVAIVGAARMDAMAPARPPSRRCCRRARR